MVSGTNLQQNSEARDFRRVGALLTLCCGFTISCLIQTTQELNVPTETLWNPQNPERQGLMLSDLHKYQ